MPWEGPPAPYRIETERLVLRCYETSDAPLMKDAIDTSLDHLRPFSVWIDDEPQSVEQKVQLIEMFRAAFETGESFVYGVFDREETKQLGGTGLHARVGPGALRSATSFARAPLARASRPSARLYSPVSASRSVKPTASRSASTRTTARASAFP